jgi:hypothetical protein
MKTKLILLSGVKSEDAIINIEEIVCAFDVYDENQKFRWCNVWLRNFKTPIVVNETSHQIFDKINVWYYGE